VSHGLDGSHPTAFPAGLGGVVQVTVMDRVEPARVVIHDEDADWLVGDDVNDPNVDGACKIYCLNCVVAVDPTLGELATLPAGYMASREDQDAPWHVATHTYDE
jgi:hypothetical protein